ncbi:MAG: ABC transporter permease subunit [Rubrivivax sp.]|nr:ABC transporter permease subunit [Rubrivivax sp.]
MVRRFESSLPPRIGANRWDLLAGGLVLAAIALFVVAGHQMRAPMAALDAAPISLEPDRLAGYALRTVVRMAVAMAVSLLFTLVVGTLAARNRRARSILLPLLDVLQSVPVLGYLSFTVVLFLTLFPDSVFGAELAAIFAIFTSQVWNMTFSFYQSLRTVPADLHDAARSLRLSPWQRFWHLDVPFATPGLVWNAMVSISGSWFFVVACEAIAVGAHTVQLPGIGSYVALAIEQRDLAAIGWALAVMLVVIGLTDLLIFGPLVAWSDQFRLGGSRTAVAPKSWMLNVWRRTRLLRNAGAALRRLVGRVTLGHASRRVDRTAAPRLIGGLAGLAYYTSLSAIAAAAAWYALHFLTAFEAAEWLHVFALGALTLVRVLVVTALAMLVWVPVGVIIGLQPAWTTRVQPIVQFLAAIPVNLVFPLAVYAIVHLRLNPDIWLSPLIVLGAQWYILFNVIAGTSTIPQDLLEISRNLQVKGWLRWRSVLLPGVAPYAITGALTAWGGAWNATIVAEVVYWGDQRLVAHGLGAYIAGNTEAGDFARIALGVAVMCVYVVVFNRLMWRPLYDAAERRFRLD